VGTRLALPGSVTRRPAQQNPLEPQANSRLALEFEAADRAPSAPVPLVAVRSPVSHPAIPGRSSDSVESLPDPFLGSSLAIRELARQAARAATTGHHLLILGEPGVGRRTLARWLHAHGPRRGRPIAEVPCAGLTEQQLDATLFGYAEGAFAGALRARSGLLELSDGGALLLAGVEHLPQAIQARLLGVLEAGCLRRHGELRSRRLHVQLLATAGPALPQLARQGRFREALYYRLAAVTLAVPPLRERPEDLATLAVALARGSDGAAAARLLTARTLDLLRQRRWRGNLDELRAVLESLARGAGREAAREQA